MITALAVVLVVQLSATLPNPKHFDVTRSLMLLSGVISDRMESISSSNHNEGGIPKG